MRYPNAKAGLKHLFVSELLTLLSAVATIAAAILMYTQGRTPTNTESPAIIGVVSGVLLISAGVMAFTSYFLGFLGLSSASLDKPHFKRALMYYTVAIVAAITQSALEGRFEILASLESIIGSIFDLFATFCIFEGINSIARAQGENELVLLVQRTLRLISLVYGLSIIIDIIGMIVTIFSPAAVAASILGLVVVVLSTVASFQELRILNRARKL